MNLTLVIMAAGMGSRYGGVKQLEGVGPNGETLMDYSIYDAIDAGFNKVVFIIRKELREAFDQHYKTRFRDKVEIAFVYQDEFKKYEDGLEINRSKPWGTGHAMLSVGEAVNHSFAILNADDYYGKGAFREMSRALSSNARENRFYLLGYKLVNTLSDHGTVSRGLCKTDKKNLLVDVEELTKIGRSNEKILYEKEEGSYELNTDDLVSMNFWGFNPTVFKKLDDAFYTFIQANYANPKAEFYIPTFVDGLIKSGRAEVEVIPVDEIWLGVTYKEDKKLVIEGIQSMIARGMYPEKL